VRNTLENITTYTGYMTLNGNKTDYVSSTIKCILHFYTINNICHKPCWKEKNSEKSNMEHKGAREQVPYFLSTDQETPCPKRHKHCRRGETVHHLNRKQFLHGHDARQCLYHSQKRVTSHHRFFKKKGPISFSSKRTTH
jgi:hypothetical protein